MKKLVKFLGVAVPVALLGACGGGGEPTETPADTAADSAVPTATAEPEAPAPTAEDTTTLDGTTLASLTGDAAHGEQVFAQCRACHSVEPGKNGLGPSLAGVVGRTAGAVEGFQYTEANRSSGITWTPEKLYQYLEKPKRVVPGTKMIFAGMAKGQDRADVIAYLQATGQ
ncbi:c-type cytochrome [Erythrobacter mangrovi]|uniref:Cytochrome c family protein n=1 Tax=Erythrobacter mangrovi TaxID=2739433 RepID=A0A7D3XC85_9SPHN|nr:cytochrome c family protein [Erythrobacter mangrovi]QKG72210.1 cytochrome c family protein [Erythrobacter mangrovi]